MIKPGIGRDFEGSMIWHEVSLKMIFTFPDLKWPNEERILVASCEWSIGLWTKTFASQVKSFGFSWMVFVVYRLILSSLLPLCDNWFFYVLTSCEWLDWKFHSMYTKAVLFVVSLHVSLLVSSFNARVLYECIQFKNMNFLHNHLCRITDTVNVSIRNWKCLFKDKTVFAIIFMAIAIITNITIALWTWENVRSQMTTCNIYTI